MISKEQAQTFLKTKLIENHREKLLEKVNELEGNARQLGRLLLNDIEEAKDEIRYGDWPSLGEKRQEAIKEILSDELKRKDVWEGEFQKTLQVIFGDRARYIQKMWALESEMMYQVGWSRRSFRAPNNPEILFTQKINWLQWLIYYLRYDLSIEDYLRYSVYMDGGKNMSYFFAGAIESKTEEGEALFKTAVDIIYGNDDIAGTDRITIQTLLICQRKEGWEAVEKLLLSAQRQEGLRQTVFESLDETSLEAFKYFLEVIFKNKLGRFSATVRALDVWVGMSWDAPRIQTVQRAIMMGMMLLDRSELIGKYLKSKDNLEVWMALWAAGCLDIMKAVESVEELLKIDNPIKQTLALTFLRSTTLKEKINTISFPFLKHENLMVAGMAMFNLKELTEAKYPAIFEDLKTLWNRVPEKGIDFSGKLFDWYHYDLKRAEVMSYMVSFADEDKLEQFNPLYEKMDLNSRENLSRQLVKREAFNSEERDLLFKMAVDKGSWVRSNALRALQKLELKEGESLVFEEVLTRKSADLRKGSISILLKQNDKALLGSIDRLIHARNGNQRLAALDILIQLKNTQRLENELLVFANKYNERSKITEKERIILKDLLAVDEVQYSAENGFGLYDPKALTISPEPKSQPHLDFSWEDEKVMAELKKLNKLIEDNKDFEYERNVGSGEMVTILVGNSILTKRYTVWYEKDEKDWSEREIFEDLPLWEIWENWWKESSLTTWDLERLTLSSSDYYLKSKPQWLKDLQKKYFHHPEIRGNDDLSYSYLVADVLDHLNKIYRPENANDLYLDIIEDMHAAIPTDKLNEQFGQYSQDFYEGQGITWRESHSLKDWQNRLNLYQKEFSKEQIIRAWKLQNWQYQTAEIKKDEFSPDLELTLKAFDFEAITEDDVFCKVFNSNSAIRELSRKEGKEWFEKYPFLEAIFEKCKARILEIELKRGDSETAVTKRAVCIDQIFGIDYLVQILQALGKDNLSRGGYYYYGNSASKNDILSIFLKRCFPKKEETEVDFSKQLQNSKITENRLLEVAMYAPQWIPMIQSYLKRKGLTEAVWWFHAHTKEYGYRVANKWESDMNKHTPMSAQDLVDGGVDVDWFHRSYKTVGKKTWEELYKAARYISDGNGHKRAQLFADAMLGKVGIREATKFINEKRRQNHVRALGLISLSRKTPEKDILKRYQIIQKFKKESKQFGNQRQVSEGLAVRIGLENLARTAGYADPIRLTWAMETKEAKEILQNAQPFEKEGVIVQLFVDDLGKAALKTEKGDKVLKSIPAKFRKDKTILKLKEQVKILRNQYKRTRKSLEEAMVRGDVFSLTEIQTLATHPVVWTMLKNLVLVTENIEKIGFYHENELLSPDGKSQSLSEKDRFRIAHCTDLHESKIWSDFQRNAFAQKRIQPFKQIFRELYLPTEDELKSKTVSRRYAGHQVQPQKTVALLKTRGWTVDYDEGLQKIYHKENFTVRLYAMADWFTPAEIEAPALETLQFVKRDTYKEVPFETIDPRIFSEVMRDVDLVVSVAHAGGVDPEASHSTIEMRKALVTETTHLLGIENYKLKGNHILVNGKLGDYSIHLGSGVVHRQPGGYISLIAVHGQHRGRLFLPFVDDDPKSAEILSKLLLLVEDDKIKDATVLRQIV